MLQLQLPLPPLGSTVELPPPPPPWTVGMQGVVKVDNRFVGLSYNIIIIDTRNSGSTHNILSKISYLLYAFLWSSNALINLKLQASLPPPSSSSPPPPRQSMGIWPCPCPSGREYEPELSSLSSGKQLFYLWIIMGLF